MSEENKFSINVLLKEHERQSIYYKMESNVLLTNPPNSEFIAHHREVVENIKAKLRDLSESIICLEGNGGKIL